ncbi:thiol:disulfide interchange protein DsbA/DsbL [Saccharobesus litoralis]|uniref:Thiol:disulfide interchange protein n=1 Tax=Saccharobesus litoralis TaxID=2172099 RepID=A0A2S0VQS1_9ALTE|nr:thiol:disulfide interchange protein DsbA/DsbL [Saccharobesus litoralis]AWB66558.1 thiol:disulfide interchange protein DsbA/DsbL [Saccharobesus litoralis]
MKKIALAFIVAIFLPLQACADTFQEGKHYEVLDFPATKTPEVTEFFSFYCGHCFQFEPLIGSLKKSLKPGVKFKKSHVDFVRGPEKADLLTKAMIAAELLKVEDKVIPKLFNAIHVIGKGRAILTETTVRGIFLDAGVEPKKFEGAINNFMVVGQVQQMKQAQKKMNIRSVPTVIVNGKYKVISKELKSETDYIALVNHLTTLK